MKCTLSVLSESSNCLLWKVFYDKTKICQLPGCHYNLQDPLDAKEHFRLHFPKGQRTSSVCRWADCGKSTRTKSALLQHLNDIHGLPIRPDSLEQAEFCYECAEIISDKDVWEDHCSTHLQEIDSFCGHIVCSSIIISARKCIFCLGDVKLSAAQRYRSYTHSPHFHAHLEMHLLYDVNWPTNCPHPKCSVRLSSQSAFWEHLREVHGIGTYGCRSDLSAQRVIGHCDTLSKISDTGVGESDPTAEQSITLDEASAVNDESSFRSTIQVVEAPRTRAAQLPAPKVSLVRFGMAEDAVRNPLANVAIHSLTELDSAAMVLPQSPHVGHVIASSMISSHETLRWPESMSTEHLSSSSSDDSSGASADQSMLQSEAPTNKADTAIFAGTIAEGKKPLALASEPMRPLTTGSQQPSAKASVPTSSVAHVAEARELPMEKYKCIPTSNDAQLVSLIQPSSGRTCMRCKEVFRTVRERNYHLMKVHRLSLYTCHCGRMFRDSSRLHQHEARHDGRAKKLICGIDGCNVDFARSDTLLRHQRRQHGRRTPAPLLQR